jgi:hypothetical protein
MTRSALIAFMIAAALAGCGGGSDDAASRAVEDSFRTVEINGAQLRPDGTLIANLDACDAGEYTVRVSEADDEVVVTVRADALVTGDLCSDGATVPLDEPLGDRELVDGSTEEPIQVEGEPE